MSNTYRSPVVAAERPLSSSEVVPALSDRELKALFRDGWSRVGVVALILDEDGNALLLEHTASDKTTDGMWGSLGETSLARYHGDEWELEPPMNTLLRGISEELGLNVPVSELRRPSKVPFFTMAWPVGVDNPTEQAFAICPIVVVSNQLRQQITEAPLSEEITSATFVPLRDVVQNKFNLRPGASLWAERAADVVIANSNCYLEKIEPPAAFIEASYRVQDAILPEMYGAADATVAH